MNSLILLLHFHHQSVIYSNGFFYTILLRSDEINRSPIQSLKPLIFFYFYRENSVQYRNFSDLSPIIKHGICAFITHCGDRFCKAFQHYRCFIKENTSSDKCVNFVDAGQNPIPHMQKVIQFIL